MSTKRIPLPRFRSVLFAADLSENSRDAFGAACSLASEEATELIVLHVQEPIVFFEMSGPVNVTADDLGDTDLLREQLQTRYVPPAPIPVEYQVKRGNAAEVIVRTAEEKDCGLIVMGTQGRTGLDRLLLGSVAESVLHRAGCPVLTFRSRSATEPEQRVAPIRTILHPTDFSRHSEAALQVARSIARDRGAQLVLLHVVPRSTLTPAVSETLVDLEIGQFALDQARSTVDGSDLKYSPKTQLRCGESAAEIVEAASELGCELIVMGSHGRGGLGRLLIGSAAESVLRRAACPVLIVKSPFPAALGQARGEAFAKA